MKTKNPNCEKCGEEMKIGGDDATGYFYCECADTNERKLEMKPIEETGYVGLDAPENPKELVEELAGDKLNKLYSHSSKCCADMNGYVADRTVMLDPRNKIVIREQAPVNSTKELVREFINLKPVKNWEKMTDRQFLDSVIKIQTDWLFQALETTRLQGRKEAEDNIKGVKVMNTESAYETGYDEGRKEGKKEIIKSIAKRGVKPIK